MNLHQREIELENAKLAKDRHLEIRQKLDSISIEFSKEIIDLSFHIDKWRKVDRKPREVERLAYASLLNKVPSIVLAENVVRALFESYINVDIGAPLTYATVVNNKLIQQRLRSLLPNEETAIPIQFKFSLVDLLVSRTVRYLPSLFIDVESRKLGTPDSIELTKVAKERLGKISIQELLTDVPMRCKPAKWTSVFHGGFLTSEMQRGNPLIGSRYHDYKELIEIDKSLQSNPEILESVNKMQNVAFKIDPNFQKYQKIIDDIRKSKIKEIQTQIDKKREEISRCEKELDLSIPIR
jgi:hypothetical protein